jgi:2-dehydro-3-deoxyphosphogluconate aldolase/(4S)-4-hydroxy-2-oxoglutarate aldolase
MMPMNPDAALSEIERGSIMAGMRGNFPPDIALAVTAALMESEINVFEFTMNSTRALEAMQAAKREYGDAAVVGMGTVLDAEMAKRVLDAGADFVVAPSFSPAVVELTHAAGVLAVPGVMTPTEIVDAWALGAKLLKIFPIGNLGIDYFKSVRGPLDHVKFICNGGINSENIPLFLKAGAVACGLAGWLTGDGSMPLETIRDRARQVRAIVNHAKGISPVERVASA